MRVHMWLSVAKHSVVHAIGTLRGVNCTPSQPHVVQERVRKRFGHRREVLKVLLEHQ